MATLKLKPNAKIEITFDTRDIPMLYVDGVDIVVECTDTHFDAGTLYKLIGDLLYKEANRISHSI